MHSGYVRLIIVFFIILTTIPVCNFQDTRIPNYRGNKFIAYKKSFKPNYRNTHKHLYYTNNNNNIKKIDTSKTENIEPIVGKHFHFPNEISAQYRRLVKQQDNYSTMKQINRLR